MKHIVHLHHISIAQLCSSHASATATCEQSRPRQGEGKDQARDTYNWLPGTLSKSSLWPIRLARSYIDDVTIHPSRGSRINPTLKRDSITGEFRFNCNRFGTHIKFIKLYKNLTQGKQGVHVGGNSPLKGFLLLCQLVQLQKQISYFKKLWRKASFGITHSSKEWCDNLKGLKTLFCFIRSDVLLYEANAVYMWWLCWGFKFVFTWRRLLYVATWQIGYANRQRVRVCLLNICGDYAAEHEITFNCNKTIGALFCPKKYKQPAPSNVFLNGVRVPFFDQVI